MRALVTGGAGFIGHHLVRLLMDRGDEAVVLDDFSTGFRHRLDALGGRVTVLEGSVDDASLLDRAANHCEVVFHEAAIASVEQSFASPVLTNHVNVNGTIEVILAAARQGVRRVVIASSAAVYGIPETLPCREASAPAPISPYGASKLAAEGYLHTLGKHLGVETVALRYFNVFGPGQDPTSDYAAVIPLFITSHLHGQQPVIHGDGENTRDFIFVEDVALANVLAADAPDASGTTINVARGEPTSLNELHRAVALAAGSRIEPRYGPPRVGDIQRSEADVLMARTILGHQAKTSLAEGIKRTVAWYRGEAAVLGSDERSQRPRT